MPDQQWRPKANPWLIALAVIVPTFMEVLDTSIASVALPNIAGNFSATIDEATWVLTSYLVANAIVLPASGWFALRFGRRRFLLFCIVVFTDLLVLLRSRHQPGIDPGGARTSREPEAARSSRSPKPSCSKAFRPQKRGAAMAIFALGVVVAPVLGPTLGGYLTDQYSWRWAFYINIPIGVLAVFMVSRFVEDPPYISSAKPGRFDGIGLGLLVVWLGALQIVLDKGQEDDWFGAPWIRWTVALAVAGFIAFLIHQFRDPAPDHQPARFQGPQLRAGLHCDDHVRRCDLRPGGDPAAVLSNRHGLFRALRRTGREPARHRSDLHHAGDRRPDQQARHIAGSSPPDSWASPAPPFG